MEKKVFLENINILTHFFKEHSLHAWREIFRGQYGQNNLDLNHVLDELFMKSFDFVEKNQILMTDMTFYDWSHLRVLVHNKAPKSTFFRCSWCLSVLNTIVLSTFVSSNQLYALRRSFPESFKKFSVLFFTLLMASTWPESLFYMYFGHFFDVRGVCLY